MKRHKKTLIGSVVVLLIGSSCCWLSTALIGIGGAGFIGYIRQIDNATTIFLIAGLALVLIFIYYFRQQKRNSEI